MLVPSPAFLRLRLLWIFRGACVGAAAALSSPLVFAQEVAAPAPLPAVPMRSLQDAAAEGNLARVNELVESGANLNALSTKGKETALVAALRGNQPEIASYLLDRGADVTIPGFVDDTPLYHAAYWGLADLVERMLVAGADPTRADSRGRTPLQTAAARGHVETVRLLAEGAAYVNAQDAENQTALDLTLRSGNEEIAILLLDAGARFVHPEPDKMTLRIDAFVKNRWLTALDRGLQQVKGPKRLQQILNRAYNTAFGLGEPDSLKWLIAKGADLNTPTVSGDPRLFVAAESGSSAIVRTMLEAGADPNRLAPLSRATPLHAAVLNANADVTRMLLDNKANPNAIDALGRTPLHLAAHAGNTGAIVALLAAGANPARIDAAGNSALHYAADSRNTAAVQKLVDAKVPQPANLDGKMPYELASGLHAADIQALLLAPAIVPPEYEALVPFLAANNSPEAIAAARDGWMSLAANGTPLIHIAVQSGSLRAVQRLLQQDRTRIGARDATGNLPIHFAAELADTSVLSELIARGAKVNDHENLARWTPLHFAAATGNAKGIALLLSKGADPKSLDANGKSPKDIAQMLNQAAIIAALP